MTFQSILYGNQKKSEREFCLIEIYLGIADYNKNKEKVLHIKVKIKMKVKIRVKMRVKAQVATPSSKIHRDRRLLLREKITITDKEAILMNNKAEKTKEIALKKKEQGKRKQYYVSKKKG